MADGGASNLDDGGSLMRIRIVTARRSGTSQGRCWAMSRTLAFWSVIGIASALACFGCASGDPTGATDLGEQRELAAAYGIEPLPLDFYAYPSIRMERRELVLFGQRLHRTRPLRGLEPLSALGQWPEIAIAIGHVYLLRFVPDGAVPDGSGDLWWKWLVVEHHPGQSVTLRVQPIEQLAEPVGER